MQKGIIAGTAERVAELLGSPAVTRIAFSLLGGSVQVHGPLWEKAAQVIRSGRVRIASHIDAPNVNGAYFSGEDLMILRKDATQTWAPSVSSTLVHETVHLINDMTMRGITELENEAAAYIAQIAYLYHGGPLAWFYSLRLKRRAPKLLAAAVSIVEEHRVGHAGIAQIPWHRWWSFGQLIEASGYPGASTFWNYGDGIAPARS